MKVFATVLFLFTCGLDKSGIQAQSDIVKLAIDAGFSTLVSLVNKTGLVPALQEKGPFTVFAPTNEAFENIPQYLSDMLTDELLLRILLAHVVPGLVKSTDLTNGLEAKTAASDFDVKFMIDDKGAFVNGAKISLADIEASNGVVHVIDKVINPMESENILDNMIENYEAFVQLARLVKVNEILEKKGPITVFVPTNKAFKSIPGSLNKQIKKNPMILEHVLKAHIVDREIYSKDLMDGAMPSTYLPDFTLKFDIDEKGARVNDADIQMVDIKASNGVVHIIDAVINPFDFGYMKSEAEPEPHA